MSVVSLEAFANWRVDLDIGSQTAFCTICDATSFQGPVQSMARNGGGGGGLDRVMEYFTLVGWSTELRQNWSAVNHGMILCVLVCVRVHVCACTRTYLHACSNLFVMHRDMHTCMYVHTCACVCLYVCKCQRSVASVSFLGLWVHSQKIAFQFSFYHWKSCTLNLSGKTTGLERPLILPLRVVILDRFLSTYMWNKRYSNPGLMCASSDFDCHP